MKTVPASLINEVRRHAHEDLDAFWALSALEEGQETFREFCLSLFRRIYMYRSESHQVMSWGYKEVEVWIEAAHYLARHYRGELDLREDLEDIAKNSHTKIGPVIALCRGWPQSELIQTIWTNLSAQPLRLDAETAWIINVKASTEELIGYIHSLPTGFQTETSWRFPREAIRAIRNRLRRDTVAQELLLASIEKTDSLDAIVSLSRLLSTVASDRQAIRDWARKRIVELRRDGAIQPMAYDMLSGQVRPVEFCLMDACGYA